MISCLTLLGPSEHLDGDVAGDFVLDELAMFIEVEDDGGAEEFAADRQCRFDSRSRLDEAADILMDFEGSWRNVWRGAWYQEGTRFLFVPWFVHGFLAGVTHYRPGFDLECWILGWVEHDVLHVLLDRGVCGFALGGDTLAADLVGLFDQPFDLVGAQVFVAPLPQSGWADLMPASDVGDGHGFGLVHFLDHLFAHGPVCGVTEFCEYGHVFFPFWLCCVTDHGKLVGRLDGCFRRRQCRLLSFQTSGSAPY